MRDEEELRLQWEALRDEDLDALPKGAVIASVKYLAAELLKLTEPFDRRPRGERWWIGGYDAGDRLRRAVDNEARVYAAVEPPPSDLQIAMVLHGLADHTSLLHALVYSQPEDRYWPEATSVGRWLHGYGDHMLMRRGGS